MEWFRYEVFFMIPMRLLRVALRRMLSRIEMGHEKTYLKTLYVNRELNVILGDVKWGRFSQ